MASDAEGKWVIPSLGDYYWTLVYAKHGYEKWGAHMKWKISRLALLTTHNSQSVNPTFPVLPSPVWSSIRTRWISLPGVKVSTQRETLGPARWGQMGWAGLGKIMYWLQFQVQVPDFSVISSVILCILLTFSVPESPFLKKMRVVVVPMS